MKKRGVIISALGSGSFTTVQVARLTEALDVTFHARLELLTREELIELAEPAEILAITRRSIKNLDAEGLQLLPNLQALAIYSTGFEWVDVAYLLKRGIKLAYLPDYSKIAVAEHAIGMMLTMSRRIHLSFDKVRGLVLPDISLRGCELRGKVLGVIGLGRIGGEVARLAQAFQMRVCYHDQKDLSGIPSGVQSLPVEDLLSSADFIILACSKERHAAPIIGAAELARIKKGAYLINPARADLVDAAAVAQAIKEKRLAGYAVDDAVPVLLHDPEIEPGRILQTGHTAWYSTEAIERGTTDWAENIIALAQGEPRNLVTSDMVPGNLIEGVD